MCNIFVIIPLFVSIWLLSFCGSVTEDRCRIFEFRCANSKCIRIPLKGDGRDDCGDNSDETTDMNDNQFECDDGIVISKSLLCDGNKDCTNDEDMKICEEHKCSKDHFLCRAKPMKCIDINSMCNNIKDCADETDESPEACEFIRNSKIVECNNETQFRCNNKELCVSKIYRCDGNSDCTDKSDEHGCKDSLTIKKHETDNVIAKDKSADVVCSRDDFYCGVKSSRGCIPKEWVCDSSYDCDVTELDEKNCSNFKCPSFKPRKCKTSDICYENEKHCDGLLNCPDSSDEDNCTKPLHSVECDPISEFKCFKKNICIPFNKVCDQHNDCGDNSDERPGGSTSNCLLNPCKVKNGGCDQMCASLFSEKKCFCKSGYEIDVRNKTNCVDIDECSRGIPCSHICRNKEGSHECECFGGFYQSKTNSSRCIAAGEKVLLFSSKNSIRELRLLHHHLEELASANDKKKKLQIIEIDFDYRLGNIFWTQFEPHPAIVEIKYRSSKNHNSEQRDLANTTIHTPIGIAFDWIHDLLYWADSYYKEISVLNVTSGHRRVLRQFSNDSKLQSIVVNPKFRRLYWTDWGSRPSIMSMGTDGQDVRTEIEDGLITPNGLTMDYYLNELYWVDARARNIRCYNLKSRQQREVVRNLDAHGFSLDVFEDWLYLSDWHNQNILQIHKITGQSKVLIATPKPLGIKLMHQLAQPENIENVCSNSPCQQLCLPVALNLRNNHKYVCQCQENSRLLDDGINCSPLAGVVKFGFPKIEFSRETLSTKSGIPRSSIYLMVGFVSAIVVSVLVMVVVCGIVMYRNYLRKVIKRVTNFNNPIYYRKTSTHDLQLLNTEALVDNDVYDICSSGLIIKHPDDRNQITKEM